jgi:hypothetical protein
MPEITISPLRPKAYSCRAFTANSLKADQWPVIDPFHWRRISDELKIFDSSPPCSLTLICCSLIQRLALAAAFAAAFFMGAF